MFSKFYKHVQKKSIIILYNFIYLKINLIKIHEKYLIINIKNAYEKENEIVI